MRAAPNAIVRAYAAILRLPPAAPDETYDGGTGTVLPSRVFRRWAIWAPMATLVLFLSLVIGAVVAADLLTQPGEFDVPAWVFAIAGAVALLFLLWTYAGAAAGYYMLAYRFDDLGLHIRKGTGVVQEITLSYRNIQNVSIQRGPIDLLLGLSKLIVETAGGGGGVVVANNNASGETAMAVMGHRGMMIGLDRFVAEDVKRDLMERMKGFHGSGLGDHGERRRRPAGAGAGPEASLTAEQRDALAAMLASLRRANGALQDVASAGATH